MKTAVCLSILLASGCTDLPDQPAEIAINCASPLSGFHSLNDPDFTRRWPVGIEGYQQNTVKVSRNGTISWNGADLATMHDDGLPSVEQFLITLKALSPRPFTVLDFDAGAPCDKVNAVRSLMVKHLGCSDQDLCFQGNWDDSFETSAS
jgi:hypothetical protein